MMNDDASSIRIVFLLVLNMAGRFFNNGTSIVLFLWCRLLHVSLAVASSGKALYKACNVLSRADFQKVSEGLLQSPGQEMEREDVAESSPRYAMVPSK